MGSVSTEPPGSELYCSECGRRYAVEDLARFGSSVVCMDCKPRFVQTIREGSPGAGVVRYGGFWKRLAAFLIDALILSAINIPVAMLMGDAVRPRAGVSISYAFSVSYLASTVLALVYYGYFLSQKAATPGKMLMGLKVVTASGGRIGVGRAIARYFAYIVSGVLLCIGYLMIAFDSQKRALHDYICGTRVIEG